MCTIVKSVKALSNISCVKQAVDNCSCMIPCSARFTTGPIGPEPRAQILGSRGGEQNYEREQMFCTNNAIKSYDSTETLDRAPGPHAVRLV